LSGGHKLLIDNKITFVAVQNYSIEDSFLPPLSCLPFGHLNQIYPIRTKIIQTAEFSQIIQNILTFYIEGRQKSAIILEP